MMLSMTGYGKAEVSLKKLNVNIEVRSLNSKFLDLSLKIPSLFKELELPMRSLIKKELNRGKVELLIHYERLEESKSITLNREQIQIYHQELTAIQNELKEDSNSDVLGHILKLPDVISYNKEAIDNKDQEQIMSGIKEACNALTNFRSEEGKSLEKALKSYVSNILNRVIEIEQYEEERLPKMKDKLTKAISTLNLKDEIDGKRLEQELIYYAEKIDLTEEKVRLNEHCSHFLKTALEKDSGKKLGFITQEMGREINTLGSKSHHLAIQKIVVEMKDELEKIKEQVLNVL